MIEVVPSINCDPKAHDCVEKCLRVVEPFAEWVQLDIADGRFTFHKTWNHPEEWPKFGTKLKLEAHLMVEDVEDAAAHWLAAGAKRIIVHVEVITPEMFDDLAKRVEKYGAELMLAANPDTPVERFYMYTAKCSRFQVLTVHPGPYGQNFMSGALDKVKALKSIPGVTVEVDGGIDLENAKLAKAAGADIIVSHSYIFDARNPEDAYRNLRAL